MTPESDLALPAHRQHEAADALRRRVESDRRLRHGHFQQLEALRARSPERAILPGDRFVVFSDLHIGNGGRRDGFLTNAHLFSSVLRDYYLSKGYHLVLNGDIEELQRFSLRQIGVAAIGWWKDRPRDSAGRGLPRGRAR